MFNEMESSFTEDKPPYDLVCADPLIINQYVVKDRVEKLTDYIKNDDYKSLLRKSIDVFYEIREMNEKKEKLDSSILKGNNEILSDFVMWWIKGISISELKTLWDNSFSETDLKDKMQLYINQFLNYRYPWGITVFLLILIYHLNRHFDGIPEDFKNLPENRSGFVLILANQ